VRGTDFVLALACLLSAATALLLNGPAPQVAGQRAGRVVMMGKKAKGSKMVTVVLEADVDELGEKGDLVQVKPAYAENVIVSKGLGQVASQEMIDRIAAEMAAAKAAKSAAKKKATDTAAELQRVFGKGLVTEVQVGAAGEVDDPSLNVEWIASQIKERASVTVDPSIIMLPEVKELGSVIATVNLHEDVTASIKVVVEKSKITFV